MNVVMLSPGYPAEMPFFTRALAAVGATGDRRRRPAAARAARPWPARRSPTTSTCRSPTRAPCSRALRGLARHVRIDQVECLWEPYMILAARIREAFGLPGMTVEQTVPFRDKERMKRVLDAAGIRTPRHVEHDHRRRRVGGRRADRLPADRQAHRGRRLGRHLPGRLRRGARPTCSRCCGTCPEVSVEEFVDGEEFTYDTVCADGQVLFENMLWYRPRPLQMRMHEWISPVSISLRDLAGARPRRRPGRWAREVLAALGFRAGFTHMEWYRKADGEVVFGEIGARPPGRPRGRPDELRHRRRPVRRLGGGGRARADSAHRSTQQYNVGSIFKRAHGAGRITHVEGLDALLAEFGDARRRRRPAAGRGAAARLALHA